MKTLICACLAVFTSTVFTQVLTFDTEEVGSSPAGFSTALTGKGNPGIWIITKDKTAPSGPNVLAQTETDDTGFRFPLCVFDKFVARDFDVSVRFKPVKGEKDQAAGLVWRYLDKDNYYIVRANALEQNVVLYKVEQGRRIDLPLKGKGKTYGAKAKVATAEWGTLRVIAKGNRFETFLNGTMLFEVEDSTFTGRGKAGLWTKADSYILFDDLVITSPK